MDFGIGDRGEVRILATHRADPNDVTPLQMISAERLAHYQRTEAAYGAVLEALFGKAASDRVTICT